MLPVRHQQPHWIARRTPQSAARHTMVCPFCIAGSSHCTSPSRGTSLFKAHPLCRAARWLGTCASVAPISLPQVELPQRFDPCTLLARWLQACRCMQRLHAAILITSVSLLLCGVDWTSQRHSGHATGTPYPLPTVLLAAGAALRSGALRRHGRSTRVCAAPATRRHATAGAQLVGCTCCAAAVADSAALYAGIQPGYVSHCLASAADCAVNPALHAFSYNTLGCDLGCELHVRSMH